MLAGWGWILLWYALVASGWFWPWYVTWAVGDSATLLRTLIEDAAPELVARLDAFYAGQPGGPWLIWSAWPTPDLSAYGMQLMGHPPLMIRLPGALPSAPPELRIIEAHDDATLRDLDSVMIHGYRCKNLLLSCILSRTSAGRWAAAETIAGRRT